jgi:hypothetical protein
VKKHQLEDNPTGNKPTSNNGGFCSVCNCAFSLELSKNKNHLCLFAFVSTENILPLPRCDLPKIKILLYARYCIISYASISSPVKWTSIEINVLSEVNCPKSHS